MWVRLSALMVPSGATVAVAAAPVPPPVSAMVTKGELKPVPPFVTLMAWISPLFPTTAVASTPEPPVCVIVTVGGEAAEYPLPLFVMKTR